MKKEVDYLIIGQGLAGSLLAYQLLERGKTVQIIDNHHNGASSSIAAGIINPITGRRFAKSW
ncbi:MAG: glycine oxidase, partial [Saprospiraceae bacterium]